MDSNHSTVQGQLCPRQDCDGFPIVHPALTSSGTWLHSNRTLVVAIADLFLTPPSSYHKL
jgi:hypothetical protein